MGSRQFSDRSHAEIYSIYRPDIPEEVIRRIVSYLRDKFHGSLDQAVDVGCGSGQSTVALAPFFKHVFGIDGSKAQIEEAMNSRIWPNISFNVGPAEELPFPDNSVQLVTACASFHWFEQRAFFSEIRRILTPGGVFAAYTYHYIKPFSENKECVEEIDRHFAEKCKGLNAYYAKEVFSSLNKYRDVDFPFEEVSRPSDIRQKVYGKLEDVTGYIKSLSGFQNMKKEDSQKAENYILDFAERLKEILNLQEENRNITLYRDFYLVFCRKGVRSF